MPDEEAAREATEGTQALAAKRPICFVISPIGAEGSDTRRRANQVLDHVITPAVEPFGYEAIRADKIAEPGRITTQVINYVLSAELVIADLTGHNANVFYELALRHAKRAPVIHIIDEDERIPFDIIDQRTIRFTHRDLDSVADCKAAIGAQIQAIQRGEATFDNPISETIDLTALRGSADPERVAIAQVLEAVNGLSARLGDLSESVRRLERSQGATSEVRAAAGAHLSGSASGRSSAATPGLASALDRVGTVAGWQSAGVAESLGAFAQRAAEEGARARQAFEQALAQQMREQEAARRHFAESTAQLAEQQDAQRVRIAEQVARTSLDRETTRARHRPPEKPEREDG